MHRLLQFCFLALLPALLAADTRWVQLKSGPFEVLTSEDEKQARIVLNELEQLRHVLGTTIGKPDLQSVFPFRILVTKPRRGPVSPVPKLARDAYVASLAEVQPETRAKITEILLEANAGRMPPEVERGLVKLFSALEANGTRVTLGPPPMPRDREWARLHMFTGDPRFSGKLRVLLYNLQQGIDADVAYRNAFGMNPEEAERHLDEYLKQPQLEPASASGRALDRRDFAARPAAAQVAELTTIDVQGSGDYSRFPGALETPAPLAEQARKEKDPAKARALLRQAAKANPKWAEPLWLEAQIEDNSLRKVLLLKAAAQLAPRSSEYQVALARAQEAAGQFNDAVKTWAAAERAAATPEQRAQITQARIAGERLRIEQARLEKEEEKRRAQAELEALRQKALEDIRAAEARANAGQAPRRADENLDWYSEGMGYAKVSGRLTRVACLGSQAVLHVQEGARVLKLHVPDPAKVAVAGGQRGFGCGVQRPARNVTAEYMLKKNAKLGTAGEVTSIEFR